MERSTQSLNIVELYAGTARSVEPFRKWRRCKIALLVDANKYAKKTYLQNYPNAPYFVKDLSQTSADWIREKAGGRVDILLGCPPCQGFSDNGRRSPWDHRNRHLRKFANLAAELQPLAIAMENVPLAAGSGAFKDFTRTIQNVGYKWTAGILNAALRGSCQCRQRLIFIAIHPSVGTFPQIPSPQYGGNYRYFNYGTGRLDTLQKSKSALLGINPATLQVQGRLPYLEKGVGRRRIPTLEKVFSGLPSIDSPLAVELCHFSWEHTANQRRRMAQIHEGGQAGRARRYYGSSYGRLHRQGLARTITGALANAGSGRFWHPTENRALTLREAARIQGFDDSFHFIQPFSEAALLVGNALDAALSKLTFDVIHGCIKNYLKKSI